MAEAKVIGSWSIDRKPWPGRRERYVRLYFRYLGDGKYEPRVANGRTGKDITHKYTIQEEQWTPISV